VDARDVNFSDSIASKRRSYKTTSRRRRRRDDGTEELGDFSDDEDESLERKLARLRREAEELKEDLAKRKEQKTAETEEDGEDGSLDDGVQELSRALDNLHASSRGGGTPVAASAGSALSKKLSTPLPTVVTPEQDGAVRSTSSRTSPGLLVHAAAFDDRLTMLEAALGIPNTPIPLSSDDQSEVQPILPTLNHLTSQLTTLSNALTAPAQSAVPLSGPTPAAPVTNHHLESLTTRIRKLTADADALSSARRRATEAAKAATAAARIAAASEDIPTTSSISSSSATEIDPAVTRAEEQAAKIQALYTTLPTISSLHPILPSILERLRSLRAIHAGAARASEDLDALERRQAETKKEIDQWREGLGVVEERMKEGEGAMKGNMEVMEPWIRELERRLDELEG
jgi:nuclear migration protein JNM1